jgi:hypothetical protein
LYQRKPLEILRFQPFVLSFDSEGRLDQPEQEKERRLISDVISAPLRNEAPGNVIEAQHRFAKKHLDHKYRWTPGPEIKKAILEAIFGRGHGK